MKKLFITALFAAVAAVAVQAQEIPERKRDEFKPIHKERLHGKKELSTLNLTEDQKAKMKAMNQDFRQQMEELKKQDNLTVKEYREKTEALRKDHQSKFQSLLTTEQKAQMEKDKEARKAKAKEYGRKRADRMKTELNLTDDQSSKLSEMRKATQEKLSAIRENSSLTDVQKKEQSKEVMKKQKDDLKSILTEEQLNKMKEQRKHHRGKKETI